MACIENTSDRFRGTQSAPARLMYRPEQFTDFEFLKVQRQSSWSATAPLHSDRSGSITLPPTADYYQADSLTKPLMKFASWVVYSFTQAPEEPDDQQLQGVVLQEIIIPPLATSIETHVPASVDLPSMAMTNNSGENRPSKISRATKVIRHYPGFVIKEMPQYVVPMACAVLPTIVDGFIWRAQVVSSGATGKIQDIRHSDDLADDISLLGLVPVALQVLSVFGYIAGLICCLWSLRSMHRIAIKLILPAAVVAFACQAGYWYSKRNAAAEWISVSMQIAYLVVVFCTAACSFIRAGRLTQNCFFGISMVGITALVQLIINIQLKFLPRILEGSDAKRSIFVAFLNPLICEVLLITPARIMVRTLRHNHPSTTFLPLTITIVVKQMVGRFVAATVRSRMWILALSIWGSIGEIIFRTTVRRRDYILYGAVFGKCLRSGKNPYALMEYQRNRVLRGHSSAFETMSNIVAIWNGIMFVITYKYSQNGDSVATFYDLALSGAIQTFFELMTDLLSTLALAVVLQIDFFALVRNRRWCWCLPGSLCIFLMSAYSNNSMMTQILCHYHGDFESRFSLCAN